MGRRVPLDDHLIIYPLVSLSLLVAVAVGMVATITIMSVLCTFRKKHRTNSPSTSPGKTDHHQHQQQKDDPPAATREQPQETPSELPLPPARQLQLQTEHSCKHIIEKSKSTRGRLSSAARLSIKLPRSMSMAKMKDMKEEVNHLRGKMKPEEPSLWSKQIILGEKNNVPSEEEDEIIYDKKGNRISTYRPRSSFSVPVSRTNSIIDQDAVASSLGTKQKQEEHNHNNRQKQIY